MSAGFGDQIAHHWKQLAESQDDFCACATNRRLYVLAVGRLRRFTSTCGGQIEKTLDSLRLWQQYMQRCGTYWSAAELAANEIVFAKYALSSNQIDESN